jgi:hypothetical protein
LRNEVGQTSENGRLVAHFGEISVALIEGPSVVIVFKRFHCVVLVIELYVGSGRSTIVPFPLFGDLVLSSKSTVELSNVAALLLH